MNNVSIKKLQIALGASVQKTTWHQGFVHHCMTSFRQSPTRIPITVACLRQISAQIVHPYAPQHRHLLTFQCHQLQNPALSTDTQMNRYCHTHIHTHSHTLTHTHSLTHTLSHTLTHTHTDTHILTLTRTHTHSHTHTHTHSHTHSLALTHTHIYIYI